MSCLRSAGSIKPSTRTSVPDTEFSFLTAWQRCPPSVPLAAGLPFAQENYRGEYGLSVIDEEELSATLFNAITEDKEY